MKEERILRGVRLVPDGPRPEIRVERSEIVCVIGRASSQGIYDSRVSRAHILLTFSHVEGSLARVYLIGQNATWLSRGGILLHLERFDIVDLYPGDTLQLIGGAERPCAYKVCCL